MWQGWSHPPPFAVTAYAPAVPLAVTVTLATPLESVVTEVTDGVAEAPEAEVEKVTVTPADAVAARVRYFRLQRSPELSTHRRALRSPARHSDEPLEAGRERRIRWRC